jgi:hypothetical protein
MPRRDGNSATLNVPVTPALKAALEAEAWESGETLPTYIRGLLARRGKWARTVRKAGNYDIAMPLREK